MFNYTRLALARKRRRLTCKSLAELAGVTPVTITRIETGKNTPDPDTVHSIASALKYPIKFFYKDDIVSLDASEVSFRSLRKMTAKERDAALSAGSLGLQLVEWVEERFSLPSQNLIDLSYETDLEAAARSLRQHWGIGMKPISNLIHLLETQGVRFLSLSENTVSVDAFSLWSNDVPYIFLNTYKSAEHSVFDAAHELGHLVLHMHGGAQDNQSAEREANSFASCFLMPKEDVKARMPSFITTDTILKAKKRWRVSAMAMAYRVRSIGLLSDWQYKSICIELTRRGYRKGEPDGIEREISAVWKKVFGHLWSEKITKKNIADELAIPLEELESLVWQLTGTAPSKADSRNQLRAV